jgi:hypothetical protein
MAKKKTAKRKAPKKKVAKRKKAKKAIKHARRPRALAISPTHKKRGRGRPSFEPTEDDRKRVETLAGYGLKQEGICMLVVNPHTGEPITDKTLKRHFERELAVGAYKANSMVAQSLFGRATAKKKDSQPGDAACAIFWAKCRMGWKEHHVVEVESKSGVLVAPAAMTPQEWIEAEAKRTAGKKEPGTEEE